MWHWSAQLLKRNSVCMKLKMDQDVKDLWKVQVEQPGCVVDDCSSF